MRLFALVILSVLATAASADPWLCITEQTTGFVFKNGNWEPGRFTVEDSQYILRKLTESDFYYRGENRYGLFLLETDLVGTPCGPPSISGNIFCEDNLRQFKFSTKSGRFLMTHTSGYWESLADDESHTPLISLGRCSTI
jgi:hypothetical protein